MSSYLVKIQTTAQDSAGEVNNYLPGAVLSDWELSDHIKKSIAGGHLHYTKIFEPLTDREAKNYRVKATALEGKRTAPNGQVVDPPFDDYIGLHPQDIIERMKKLKADEVEIIRQYERGGLNRDTIIDFVAPSEREPYEGYSDQGVRDILEKMDLLDEESCRDIILYEMNHGKRPAIIEYVKEEDEITSQEPETANEEESDSSTTPEEVGAPA